MEIVLIILTSTLISAFFFVIYNYAYQKGLNDGKEMQSKEDSNNKIELTDENDEMLKQIERQYNFIKYGKGE